MIEIDADKRAKYLMTCRVLAVLSAVTGAFYLKWLFFDAIPDNHLLFWMLVGAEVFNITQAAGFWYTISTQRWTDTAPLDFSLTVDTVDVFITVFGEPADVVERTLLGVLAIRHPRKKVWILDDGHSPAIRELARIHGAGYLTRPDRRGAKAGNINEGLRRTNGDFVAVFDADHVPMPQFLECTMGGFHHRNVAFVQTPQSYSNRRQNRVAAGAHEQQALFYGPIMRGRNSCSAVFACGTNIVYQRAALDAVGGMPEDSITEDLRVSLELLKVGYTSEYVSSVLAHGMGPLDVAGYFSQQLRWARGGLEIFFKHKPFFRGMRLPTRIQYGLSFLYWFTGLAYSVYLILPAAFLFTGQRPVIAPNQYPVYFLPYILITLVTMAYASDFKITFRTLWFTLASFPLFIVALPAAILGRNARFVVTSKGARRRTLRPVIVQLIAVIVLAVAVTFGVFTRGVSPAVMNNVAFALGDILVVQGFIRYALRAETVPDDAGDDLMADDVAESQRLVGGAARAAPSEEEGV